MIDVLSQLGNRILVEATTGAIWEIQPADRIRQLVRITGTDIRFHRPKVGAWAGSVEPVSGKVDENNIQKGWPFVIQFADGKLISGPIKSARVEGEGWGYDVF